MKNSPLTLLLRCLLVSSAIIFFNHIAIAGVVITNGLTHIHKVEEGQRLKGVIEIQNPSDKPQAVKVYQKDYSFTHTGSVFYNDSGRDLRSNAEWMDFSPAYFVLDPYEKSVVLYEITIPDGADLIGSYWSVLMVEAINPKKDLERKSDFTINTIMRYAVQIVTNIGDTGERNIDFLEAKLNRIDGQKVGEIALENTGERLLVPVISMELFNKKGISLGITKTEKKKLYPGTSAKFYLDLEQFPEGDYQVIVIADCENDDIFGLNVELKISDD